MTDLAQLRPLHSLGLFYLGPLSLYLCWNLVPERERLVLVYPLLSLCAGSFNTAIFAISESHVMAAILWPVVFFVRYGDWSAWRQAFVGGSLGMATLLAYESMVIYGLPLAALAGWRALRPERRWQRALWVTAALWFLAGTLVAAYSILWPRDPLNRNRLIRAMWHLNSFHRGAIPPPTFLWVGGLIALFLVSRMTARARSYRLGYGVTLIFTALALAVMLRTLQVPALASWGLANEARYLVVIMPAVLLMVFLTRGGKGAQWSSRLGPAVWVLAVLAFAQVAWQGLVTYQWSVHIHHLEVRLRTERGLVTNSMGPFASWTDPCLSIVLAPGGHVRVIVEKSGRTQAFDPKDPRQLPDLRRYGIRYDDWVGQVSEEEAKPSSS